MAYFYVTITGNFGVFDTQTLKQIFWKKKTFFKKPDYRFLTESTKIENATFPLKTGLSEANFKTNRMGSTKWTYYHKEWSFASNSFILFFFSWKILFQFKNLLKRVGSLYQLPNLHIHTFSKPWSFIGGCFFPVSNLKHKSKRNISDYLCATAVSLLTFRLLLGLHWYFQQKD